MKIKASSNSNTVLVIDEILIVFKWLIYQRIWLELTQLKKYSVQNWQMTAVNVSRQMQHVPLAFLLEGFDA